MTRISEVEFARICSGLREDRETILKHNPIGTPAETMLWMLMSCLVIYLSLDDKETPCFPGRPDENTYREAIRFILQERRDGDFDAQKYLEGLIEE
jgi:hypothetical protein